MKDMKRLLTMTIGLLMAGAVHVWAEDFETAAQAVRNMGLGWNLGNTLDAHSTSGTDLTSASYWGQQDVTSETQWGQYVTKPELMKMMKDAGFGAIRVPVTWYNHMDIEGNVDAAWMSRVREVVDYVVDQGMYCIVNVHHDTGADSDGHKSWLKANEAYYAQNKARYEHLWRQIAETFRDYDEHLLFESYNEMLDGYNSWCYASFNAPNKTNGYNAAVAASAYSAINSYAQSFVTTVRATGGNNARRNLIVNTYCAANGYGSWNSHLKDPLLELRMPEGEKDHIAFEIHAYPELVTKNQSGTVTGNRSIADIKKEVDDMIGLLKTHLMSKGAPVIFGEWGTSNVDATETDYMKRPELMKQFCQYFVEQCKANDIATFFWMNITDGAARLFPAFSQADLARWLLQAYHGSDYNPVLPARSDYSTSCISTTVVYNQQWSELNLTSLTFTANDYVKLQLELEEAPASGVLHFKIYGSTNINTPVAAASSELAFTAAMGTIRRVTLQCMEKTGTAKVKSVWLVKKNGERVPSDPSVFWGCVMNDIHISYPVGIGCIRADGKADGRTYSLSGRRQEDRLGKGVFIKDGRKFMR